jgi:hypothetical protein
VNELTESMALGALGGAVTAGAICAANFQANRKPWESYTGPVAYVFVTVLYPVLGACMAGFGDIIGFKGAAALAGFTGLAGLAKLAGEVREAQPTVGPTPTSAPVSASQPPQGGGGSP